MRLLTGTILTASAVIMPLLSAVPRLDHEDRDMREVLTRIWNGEASQRQAAAHRIFEDRQHLVAELVKIVTEGVGSKEEATGEVIETAINLLGQIRAAEAVPLLVENLVYQVPQTTGPSGQRLFSWRDLSYPCTNALIRIGPACVESLIRKVETSGGDLVVNSAAEILKNVLGTRVAISYLNRQLADRSDKREQGRLTLLRLRLVALAERKDFEEPLEEIGTCAVECIASRKAKTIERLRAQDCLLRYDIGLTIRGERAWLISRVSMIIDGYFGRTILRDPNMPARATRERAKLTAIQLLGALRAEGAVPLLVEQLTFQSKADHGNANDGLPPEVGYPAVAALIDISPRLPALEPLMKKIETSPDARVELCGAAALRGILGKQLAQIYVNERMKNEKDPDRWQRLFALLKQIGASEPKVPQ